MNERPRSAPARVLLHARLRGSEGQGHRLGAERQLLQVDRRRQDLEDRATCRTATTTTCGSRPNDSNRMIEANDGGGNVSVNGGETWTPEPMPTAQFYHVITTKHVPYHVCGAQQDNTHRVRVERAGAGRPGRIRRRRRSGVLLGRRRRERLHRQRSAQPGHLLRRQLRRPDHAARSAHRPGARRSTRIPTTRWATRRPTSPSASSGRSRSCSRRPIRGSSTSARSTCGSRPTKARAGTKISPDLTRHDPKTMGPSGGPITKDNTGVETYATVFTIAPSPKDGNVIWAGSDDGYVQVTRNGGTNWKNVTPKELRRLRAHQPDRGVAVPRRHRLRRREPLSAGRLQAVRLPHRRLRRDLDDDRQRRRRRPTSRARSARTSSSRSCCISAPSTASTSRSTTARTGSRCGRTCRTRRCTTSRSRSATS